MLIASGITIWISLQALVNMGAVTSSLPITGIPLPLVSFGGTSLVVSLAAMGVLLNIAKQGEDGPTPRRKRKRGPARGNPAGPARRDRKNNGRPVPRAMKVVIAGGGTAGHVNPALALARALSSDEVIFAGTTRGAEATLVPQSGYELEIIEVRGFDRSKPTSIVSTGAQALRATKQASLFCDEPTPTWLSAWVAT